MPWVRLQPRLVRDLEASGLLTDKITTQIRDGGIDAVGDAPDAMKAMHRGREVRRGPSGCGWSALTRRGGAVGGGRRGGGLVRSKPRPGRVFLQGSCAHGRPPKSNQRAARLLTGCAHRAGARAPCP